MAAYLLGFHLSLIVRKAAQMGRDGFRRYEIIGRIRYLTQLLFKMDTILILSRVSQWGLEWKKRSYTALSMLSCS